MNRTRRSAQRCAGTAVVELALCLPVLVLVLVATLDACTMFHVQQSMKIAAYEGTRVGIVPGAEAVNVQFQCETLLDTQGVNGYTITMTPADLSTLSQGDFFSVQIDADFDQNALAGGLYNGKTLTKSVTLRVK